MNAIRTPVNTGKDENAGTLPQIAVLATGGTIAGRSHEGGTLIDYQPGSLGADTLLAALPELALVARLRCRQVANIGSEDMTPTVWFDLTRAVLRETADPEVTGIVVLHGTDTMEETAFFLDLTYGGKKPVVMTGAMRPADSLSADGPLNILDAARIACFPESASRGVLVAMNGIIHQARDVVKSDTLKLDAFQSRTGGCHGRMVDQHPRYHRQPESRQSLPVFDLAGVAELPRVEILYGHAGQKRELVDAAVAAGAWGLVHAGVGMGNVHCDVRPALAEVAAAGVPVVCASRVPNGPAPLTERHRRDQFIAAGDLSPQKARVLLQLALTQTSRFDEIQRLFDAL